MVDTFLFLTIARTGDQLQGIKKGILELADVVAVNKADGPHEREARAAARDLAGALHMMTPASEHWSAPVLSCSAQTGMGLDKVWGKVLEHRAALEKHGELASRRADQQVEWMWAMIREQLMDRLQQDPKVRERLPELTAEVRRGTQTPTLAAVEILDLLT
jgi:LAO/AO transport system kinase